MANNLLREHLSVGNDIELRKERWIKTALNIPEYRNQKFYDILPNHLKDCFLYLAVFPYDSEIPAQELIRMWIAEGFVASQDGNGASLEECAEAYLQDLIRRNLLKIGRNKAGGKVKTCRIHRMLHEFCKTEAGKGTGSFLTEIKFSDGDIVPQLSEARRLSIHSNIPSFISSKPSCPHTRSFFVFSEDQECLFVELISPEAFKLLRVLDARRIKFVHIDSDMSHLLHLRYLALSSNMSILPARFSQLWNIQTLLVNTSARTLDVKPDILEFIHLRHFKTNASANLCKVGKAGKGGENIQSLAFISPESCTKELFNRARNLKKLGIRGKLSLLLEGKVVSFDSLAALGYLEHLKLINDVYPIPPSAGRLKSLPPHNKFPSTLKSLTLAGTYLDWSQMSILVFLEKLEVLKLKNKAFMGRIWETEDGGFRTLKVLHIEETDLGIWYTSARHFPELRTLKLHSCGQLQEVPIQLAGIPSLTLLDLYETNLAAGSANIFMEEKARLLKRDDLFKLSIYPPSSSFE